MKNLNYFFLIIFQILITDFSFSQSFYRSVADVDSFAYVTMDDKILILKRDETNELRFVDSISFAVTHRSDNFNSAIVINDYLLVSSKDSVILFSISERENPVELHRINIGNIIRVNEFGDYCFVYTSTDSKLLGIENDSLKLLAVNPKTIQSSPYFYYNRMSLSYPYIMYWTISDYVVVEKYDTVQNNFAITDSIEPEGDYQSFSGVLSNSNIILTCEYKYVQLYNAFIQDWFRYTIIDDTLANRTLLCNFLTDEYPWGILEGHEINDTWGIVFIHFEGFKIVNPNNPCSGLASNVNINNSNFFTIGNSVYRIGNEGLYFLYQQGTFHKFEFPPVSVENNNKFPNNISLEQNYPNPFNPTTTIKYAIGSRQFTTIKVYDVLGREVAILVNEEKQPGVYEVEFQSTVGGRQLASGIYYYQLKAGNFVETKKMMVVK